MESLPPLGRAVLPTTAWLAKDAANAVQLKSPWAGSIECKRRPTQLAVQLNSPWAGRVKCKDNGNGKWADIVTAVQTQAAASAPADHPLEWCSHVRCALGNRVRCA
jgi:hypothetical protein